jgi:predicted membrane protein
MKKIVIGVIIMLLGISMLFHNIGAIPWNIYHVIVSWQSLLIAIGVVLLFDKKTDNKNAGVILIVVGAIFLIPRIFEDINIGRILVPLLIIAGGIFFIVKSVIGRKRKTSFFENRHYDNFNETYVEKSINNEEVIRREYVFTGVKERWTYGEIKKAEIEAVFSGVELDFTQAELSADVQQVVIRVSSVFSGVTLYVPAEWNILVQKTGIFGSFVDKRPNNALRSSSGKLVILDLEAVFGGGEIKCYK